MNQHTKSVLYVLATIGILSLDIEFLNIIIAGLHWLAFTLMIVSFSFIIAFNGNIPDRGKKTIKKSIMNRTSCYYLSSRATMVVLSGVAVWMIHQHGYELTSYVALATIALNQILMSYSLQAIKGVK